MLAARRSQGLEDGIGSPLGGREKRGFHKSHVLQFLVTPFLPNLKTMGLWVFDCLRTVGSLRYAQVSRVRFYSWAVCSLIETRRPLARLRTPMIDYFFLYSNSSKRQRLNFSHFFLQCKKFGPNGRVGSQCEREGIFFGAILNS